MLSSARKIAVMSCIVLLVSAEAEAEPLQTSSNIPTPKTEVEKRIQEMCTSTESYPKDCTKILWEAAPNTSDPRILMQILLELIVPQVITANEYIGKTHNDSSCMDYLPLATKYLHESIDQLKSAAPINKDALKNSVLNGCAEIQRCMATLDSSTKLSNEISPLIHPPQLRAIVAVEWAKKFLLN